MKIQIDKIIKRFGERVILDETSYVFTSGIYTLTGASGDGKTTLARILGRLTEIDGGSIVPFDYSVSYMFQESRLFPWMNVLENIVKVTGCSVNRATELLGALELNDDIYKYPHELSVGMQRRVSIARTLSVDKADLYIFDEPFAGLDEDRKHTVCKQIRDTVPKDSIVIIISHEIAEVSEITDHILKLESGKLLNEKG